MIAFWKKGFFIHWYCKC